MHTTLIHVDVLQTLLQGPSPVVLFDCSGDLIRPELGVQMYQQGHIAGAHYANVQEGDLCGTVADGVNGGRHPLPVRARVANWLGQYGVDANTQVVVYDQVQNLYAARLWWLIKWCGHEAVAVLDGATQAWRTAGLTLTTQVPSRPQPVTLALREPLVQWLSTAKVFENLNRNQVLIDARARARYLGETEPLDPVAGHIPGALNRPFQLNLGQDGCFKSAQQLRQEFTTLLGDTPASEVVHQCGSGISAIPNLLAMEVAGLGRTRLYPGSWSEWCTTPGMPCETAAASNQP